METATLPSELSRGAVQHGQEYTWSTDSFRDALKVAPHLGYACLGGQFWILPTTGEIYELFWVEANASDRLFDESWDVYAKRSCIEVSEEFELRLRTIDFAQEALKFRTFRDLTEPPVFNAYFVTDQEWASLQPRS